MKIKIVILICCFAIIYVGCSGSGGATFDSTKNQKIANEVAKYLTGCPSFFIPPVEGTDGTKMNKSGAVAWTPSFNTGPIPPSGGFGSPDTKSRYISKLTLAGVAQQTNWNQYRRVEGSGYPGYELWPNGPQNPISTYQAGFVCFLLVWRAVTDAGFDPWLGAEPNNANALKFRLNEVNDINNAVPGDLIFYNFDNNESEYFEHVAILIEKSG